MKFKNILHIAALAALALTVPATAHAENWAKYKIMLDPGHGGTDPGASGPTAPHEATLALRCAKTLTTKFTNLGAPYRLTRSTDTFISLSARKSASVSYDPYIFCSIHLNAFNGTANGTETWYYWTTGNSKLLANCVHASLIKEMGRTNRGVKQNGWTVITGSSSVPAILTEGLFVDNATEHNLIKTEGSTGYNNWVNGHLYGFYDRLKQLSSTITNPRGATTTTTPDPSMSVSNTSWRFDCTKGSSDSHTFTITGANLTSDISVTASNSVFTVSTSSIAKTGGSLKVTFTPTTVGEVTGKITLKSGTVTKTITLTGVATAPALTMKEKWNFSQANGTQAYKGWDVTKVRNLTYGNGRLYMVYDTKDIKVVKSGTYGADDTGVLGDLNKGNTVTGGTYALCDVKYCAGKTVACNLAIASNNDPLRVYAWDNDQALPTLVLNTTDFGGAPRLGDCLGWYGDWTNGQLVFANDDGSKTRIVTYTVTNGKANATPTVKYATTDGTTQLKTAASTRIYPQADGYWIDGKDNNTAYLDINGKREFYMDQDVSWGNAVTTFDWEGTNYAMAITYDPMEGENWNVQTDEQKAKNYTNGRAVLMRNDEGYAKAVTIGNLPTIGLSAVNQNPNCTSNVIVNQSGSNVEAWVFVANQGIAYYLNTGGTAPTYTYETIRPATPVLSVTKSDKAVTSITMPETTCGIPATYKVKVSGQALTGDINVAITGTDKAMFTTNVSTIDMATAAKTVTITYTPSYEGTHKANLKVTSTGATAVTVPITGTCNPTVVFDPKIKDLSQDWIYSTNEGNLASAPWFDASTDYSRAIAGIGDNVYVLNATSWSNNYSINVLNASNGTLKGNLDLTGISGGTYTLASLGVLGTNLAASNYTPVGKSLKVYTWTSPTAKPTVLLEDASHGDIDAGEHMGTYGDMTDGKLGFCDGTKIVWYSITNGTANPTANVVTLDKAMGGARSSHQVVFEPDGTFWVNCKETAPTHFSATGQTLGTLAISGQKYGTGMTMFDFGDRRYAAVVNTLGSSETAAWGNAAMELVDVTDTAKPESLGHFPSQGLGTASWGLQGVTTAAHDITDDGNKANFYVLAPKQGAAKYSYNGAIETGVSAIAVDNAGPDTRVYNLQGVKVDAANPAPGIYIVNKDGKTTKQYIK